MSLVFWVIAGSLLLQFFSKQGATAVLAILQLILSFIIASILRSQIRGPLGLIIAPVVAALEDVEPSVTVPIAAYSALSTLTDQRRS